VIDLARRGGRPLVVGHRGAPRLAPENTIRAFEAAVALGVDLVELDVLALHQGPLVVAHSDRLEEITHGAATGRIGSRSLDELRALAPELPTFDDVLAWFAGEAPGTGLHVDLKLRARLDELVRAIRAHGLTERTVISSAYTDTLREVARAAPEIRVGLTYPEDRLELSRRPVLRPVVRLSLAALRATAPVRLSRLLERAGASALMLHHTLVAPSSVAGAHAVGVPVLAWTVDEPGDVLRVVEAGVDGVITNDPKMLLATLAA
jgi:glycerophosphoryl diester phosphodiesterase